MGSNSIKVLGASNHAKSKREENDFYATEPKATILLMEKEKFNNVILEPACGQGHMSEVLKSYNYNVLSSDLIDRGYGIQKDFFDYNKWAGDIITNPPYKIALPFLKHALNIINTGSKEALFLRLLFLEGIERGKFFKEFPPKKVYVSSARLNCAKNGDFKTYSKSTAMAFAWFVWEKNFKENTIIDWI